MLNKISFLFIVLCLQTAHSSDCVDLYQSKRNIQVQQIKSIDDICFLSVSPKNAYIDLVYRSYVFSDRGSLLVFNSFGDGDSPSYNENELTGAKEFYFFPRLQKSQSFSWDSDVASNKDYLKIDSNHYFNMKIDTETGLIASVDQADIKIDAEVRPDNQGGVRISPKSGLIYELPFTKGQAPSSQPSIRGVFIDSDGVKCKVKVGELFNKDSNGETYFKMNDHVLKQFLKVKCPKLDVGYM